MKSSHYANHNRQYTGTVNRSSGGNVICIAALSESGQKIVNQQGLERAQQQIRHKRPSQKTPPSIKSEINEAFHALGKGSHTALHRIGCCYLGLS